MYYSLSFIQTKWILASINQNKKKTIILYKKALIFGVFITTEETFFYEVDAIDLVFDKNSVKV